MAAFAEVAFGGETWDKELPAAAFDALPMEGDDSTVEDSVATRELVILVAIIGLTWLLYKRTVSLIRSNCNRTPIARKLQ